MKVKFISFLIYLPLNDLNHFEKHCKSIKAQTVLVFFLKVDIAFEYQNHMIDENIVRFIFIPDTQYDQLWF